MEQKKSRLLLWLAALAVPPLAVVLLWWRPVGVWRKLLGTVALLAWSVVLLVYVFGLRVELAGTGITPIFSFGTAEEHWEELEGHRASQESPPSMPVRADADAPWPRFLGPHGDGRSDEPIRTDWPDAGLEPLWRQPVGGGYGSFAIAGGLAYTLEQRRAEEVVTAYDLRTGREVWHHAWTALFSEAMGGDGPRSTPTWDEGRLYALGATGELRVLDAASGELLWRTNVVEDAGTKNLYYGQAASPLVREEDVVVVPGCAGNDCRSVVAYDKRSGEVRWRAQRMLGGYATPVETTLAGRRQLVIVGGSKVFGVDVDGGELLWAVPWVTQFDINAAQPVLTGEGRFFVSSGYDHGGALIEVTAEGDGFAARTVWENNAMKNRFASSVLREGHLYGLDERILTCLDAATGERRWKGGRYGHGQLVLAGDHLVVLTEKGELALVEATPERFTEVARFDAIRGKTWNAPAIGDGVLLVRNSREMAAFEIAPP